MRTRIALAAATAALCIPAGLLAGPTTTAGALVPRPNTHPATAAAQRAAQAADLVALSALVFLAKAQPAPVSDGTSVWTPDWECIRIHESGGLFNSPSAPSGAYGIVEVTWHSLGYGGWPYQAPAAQQNQAALTLYQRYGFSPWSSRYACGL
jgi:hypothetical protein